ncbi:M20 aminoacylase family protein [Tropicibacter naphthalenivorans]|uniref:Putative hydrolase YxeP n=1 Tax=Tropicibacter naphthalenivorans TaxID=441103 RepID=A0A0P1GF35_9RHOB|nr:M20 aminoacylase family protein [Tropicibacter naphthalenivorans]CUH80125.1 putative hydrolase YxeP [Tropicibacter naphthalenivorans]SMC84778.1 hippurate hydrolase [Tropicibacter naphthalenivorans]
MAVINRIAGFAEDMAGWRRHLHMHPELCLECHETAAFVVARLREFGVDEIHEGIATSGVVGVIRGQGDGPVTGLRADMDALPMEEATGAIWASTVPGRMHACGHDGHTAMLLGAARYLCETRNFAGSVVLIFQPAEETIGGGRIMVEEGIMDRFGVEEVFALHTDPFGDLGEFRTCPGPIMASVDDFELTLIGKGGHAAYPQECVDPIPCALAIGQALQTVVSRNTDPLGSLVVALSQINGGTAKNIIPERVEMAGTVRSLDPKVRDMAERRISEIIAGQAASYGVRAELNYMRTYPPTVNHAAQTRFAVDVAREVSGKVVDDLPPEMGAEDFSYMLEARPGAFLFLGQGKGPSVHHPAFDFNDAAAPYGASFFARVIETRHGRGR